MLDVAVIGSGPAALSAALNCRQRNKEVCIFGRSLDSSLLFSAEKVDNYLGMPDRGGEEMLNEFFTHANKNGVQFKECKISQILNMGDYFMINADNTFFEAKAIILAMGISKSKAISGEMEMLGKGVSYCATCDGMLYRGKKVVVISENEEGEAEANFLADVCSEVVYIPLYPEISHLNENVQVLQEKPTAILEEDGKLFGVETKTQKISCDGVFFAKNTTPPASLIMGLETDGKDIIVNRSMQTNIPMVYAAGDCTGAPYQIAKAVGEGLVAALAAVGEIDKKAREKNKSS